MVKIRTFVSMLAVAGVVCAVPWTAHGMGGKAKDEHPGKEHPGKHAKEHPGEEHPGTKAKAFTGNEIKAAMTAHIEALQKSGGGTHSMHDDELNKDWTLKFVKIHDPVRMIDDKTYFACTDFKSTTSDDVLDLDFWLEPSGDALKVTATKIHKVNGKPRFTYEGNKLVKVKAGKRVSKERLAVLEGSAMEEGGKEHPGKEHPGKEHPGKEHPGEEHPGTVK